MFDMNPSRNVSFRKYGSMDETSPLFAHLSVCAPPGAAQAIARIAAIVAVHRLIDIRASYRVIRGKKDGLRENSHRARKGAAGASLSRDVDGRVGGAAARVNWRRRARRGAR